MALATLTIDINAKLANIERDLGKVAHLSEQAGNRIESAFKSAGAAIVNFGAALGVGALGAGIKQTINDLDALQKASQKIGTSVESLSALNYAGSLSDVNFDALVGGLRKLSVTAAEAASGSKEAKAAFDAIGVSVRNSAGEMKSSDELLAEIADKFAQYKDGVNKTALAVQLFGRAGADLIPLLNGGSEGLKQMRAEAEKLGVIIGGDLAKKSEEFNDNLTRIAAALGSLKIQLAGGIIEDLVSFTNALVAATKASGGFFSGLMLLDGNDAVNPAKAFYEAESALEKLRKSKEATENSWTGRNASWYVKDDLAILDAQIAQAEKRVAALRELAAKKGAFDYGPPIIGGGGAKDAPSVVTGKDKADKLKGSPEDYADRLNKMVADSITGSALIKTQELARAQSQLDEMYLDGLISLDLYTSAQLKLAGATGKSAEEKNRLNTLLEATPTAKLEAVREDMQLLADSLERGRISESQYLEAVSVRLNDMNPKLEETKTLAQELGMTFSSAFEDAIIGGEELSGVLKGLADDIMRIMIRKSITEPLANSIVGFNWSSLFGGFRASGGPVSSGSFYVVGEKGPELLYAGTDGTVVPNSAIGGGGSNVVVNIVESPGKGGQVTQRNDNGVNVLDVFVERVKSSIAMDISDGRGSIPSAMNNAYGLNRAAGAY